VAIDTSAIVANILGATTTPFLDARVTGTWDQDGTSESVSGILVERNIDLEEFALDDEAALFVVDAAEFITVTTPAKGDTYTIAGQAPWRVRSLRKRVSHFAFQLGRRIQRATT
jgi:hypothetical protein